VTTTLETSTLSAQQLATLPPSECKRLLIAYEKQVLLLQLWLGELSGTSSASVNYSSLSLQIREKWKKQLRGAIRQKLNPLLHGGIKGGTSAKAQYISTLFVEPEEAFTTIFPKAVRVGTSAKQVDLVKKSKKLPWTMLCGDKCKPYPTTKFIQSTKLFSWVVESLEDLDEWFGGDDWGLVHNNKSVGFACLPIEFRLVKTTVNSHRNKN